jgi:hypothetical protein
MWGNGVRVREEKGKCGGGMRRDGGACVFCDTIMDLSGGP